MTRHPERPEREGPKPKGPGRDGPGQEGRRAAPLADLIRELPPPHPDLPLPVLRNREDRFLRLLEGMEGFVVEFDADGRVRYASPGIDAIVGFSPRECVESNPIEFHPDDVSRAVALGAQVRASGRPGQSQTRIRHRDGHWVWVETTLLGWHDGEGDDYRTITFNRDISALKRAEAARRESETRYAVVSRMTRDLIHEVDREGRPTYQGPGSEDVFGYGSEELLSFGWSMVHPDDLERVRELLEAEFRDAERGIESGPRLMEFRARHRDGHWVHLESLGRVYSRSDGELRYLGVSRDVTERRRAEEARRKLEEGMRRAQKLESLGVLAGGIAHDFNNLLTPILGAAGLARQELPEGSPLHARLDTITRAARRAAALTDQMLAYAGQRPLRVERVDLSALVRDIRELASSSISGKTSFELDLAHDLPAVEGEAAQLSQVVLNLVTNASESLRDGVGEVSIRTGACELEAPPSGALFAETMQPGPHVFIEVRDAGSGMDPETAARIFDPFYTTKFTGRGLGLAAVAGIVRAHRGAIQVETAPSRGTCFRVLLPATTNAAREMRTEPAAPAGWSTRGLALVIDDDAEVRELAAATLRRVGLTVVCAGDGYEGVKLFTESPDEVRVVLLDRTMPALSGGDTLDAIRAVRPDARIVLISGYSEAHATAELAQRRIEGFVQKPFLPDTLIARVREAMEAPAHHS